MIKISRRRMVLASLFCIFCICGVLLTGSTGLYVVLKSIQLLSGGGMHIGSAEGSLFGHISLEKVHITRPDAEVQIDKFDWNWSPAELLKGQLHVSDLDISGVVIRLRDNPAQATTSSSPVQLPRFTLPLGLVLNRVAVHSLLLQGSDGSELIAFDTIDVQVEGRDGHLSIGNLSLQGPEIGLSVHGTVDFDRNWHVDLLGNWRLINYGFHQLEGTLSATGPLAAPHAIFAVNSPADIRVEGDVKNLLDKPEWTATLAAKNVDLEALIQHCPKIELATVDGQLAGNTEGYHGQVQAMGTWGTMDKMHLQSSISAGLWGIDFDSLRIDRGDGWAVAENAKINWKRLFDWEGLFHFKNFDPSHFFDWLPGKLDADLTSVGTVRDDLGVDVTFDIFRLDGTLREQPVSAAGKIVLTENDVRTEGLVIRSGQVEGSASIEKGMLSWADKLSWSGEIRLDNFDPAGIYPDFPGQVSGLFAGEGFLGPQGAEGYLKISDITGNLRGNALAGSGEIRLSGETIRTSGLFLSSGASKLVVQGQAGDAFALDISLTSPDIGALVPDAGGSVNLLGKLRGSYQAPEFDLDMHGLRLALAADKIARLEAKVHSRFGTDSRLQGTFLGEKMTLANVLVDMAQIDFSGSFKDQVIKAQAAGEFGKAQLHAKATHDTGWIGEISDAYLTSSAYGNWQQQRKSIINIDAKGIVLDDFCLAEGEGSVCAGGYAALSKETGWRFKSHFSALSLNWLHRLKLLAVPMNGLFSGEVSATGEGQRIISGQGEIRLPETTFDLGVDDEEFRNLRVEDTVLKLNLTEASLQTDLVARMQNGSRLTLSANTKGGDIFSKSARSQRISGSLGLENFDLAILTALTGYGFDPTGQVNSSFTIAGTIGRPELIGECRIDGGGIALPYQGITLENVRVSVTAAENGAKIVGHATSGPGEVTAEGHLQYGDVGVEGKLHVLGNNFLLLNLPEYAIRANPDVQVQFAGKKTTIKGSVQIPYGRITPEEMKDSVQVSQDAVVVNGRQEVKVSGWPFSVDLNVIVGNDVRVNGHGLNGRLSGELRVKTDTDEFPTAQGELDIREGIFSIYGRTLDIERGRILFTGGPIDNPGVDVRAQQKFSDEQAKNRGYTVGVDISGLVQDLNYHLFSDPYMDDTEILSQMIVGHSLAFSSKEEGSLLEAAATSLGLKGGADLFHGIGSILQIDDMHIEGSSKKENVSLVVGKKLTKNLYIGYDMNMFSQLGQFRVRYDLTHGFAVETRSSSQSTGADLLYSFEK